jgi:hypothetical protein
MIELEKEKELTRIERATTMMFPDVSEAPTNQSYLKVGHLQNLVHYLNFCFFIVYI